MLWEVTDRVNGVRIMDSDGEDITVEHAMVYFAARAKGRLRQRGPRPM
jgi:hypothetical protein